MVIYTTKRNRWQAYLHYWHFCTSTLCYNSACSAQCFSSLMWQLQSCSTSTLYAKRARLCLFTSHIIVLLLPACCTHLSQWMGLRSSTSVWACCDRDLYGLLVAIYFWVLRRHHARILYQKQHPPLHEKILKWNRNALLLFWIFFINCAKIKNYGGLRVPLSSMFQSTVLLLLLLLLLFCDAVTWQLFCWRNREKQAQHFAELTKSCTCRYFSHCC